MSAKNTDRQGRHRSKTIAFRMSPEEAELRELTDSALGKLQAMNDTEFAELELYPDFDE